MIVWVPQTAATWRIPPAGSKTEAAFDRGRSRQRERSRARTPVARNIFFFFRLRKTQSVFFFAIIRRQTMRCCSRPAAACAAARTPCRSRARPAGRSTCGPRGAPPTWADSGRLSPPAVSTKKQGPKHTHTHTARTRRAAAISSDSSKRRPRRPQTTKVSSKKRNCLGSIFRAASCLPSEKFCGYTAGT